MYLFTSTHVCISPSWFSSLCSLLLWALAQKVVLENSKFYIGPSLVLASVVSIQQWLCILESAVFLHVFHRSGLWIKIPAKWHTIRSTTFLLIIYSGILCLWESNRQQLIIVLCEFLPPLSILWSVKFGGFLVAAFWKSEQQTCVWEAFDLLD